MADSVAIISVLASSAVALAAVAAQVWQSHLDRESRRDAWLRDRRADTYISVFRLFEKTPDQVEQAEWEQLVASLHVYGSERMIVLFAEWGKAGRTTREKSISKEKHREAYESAISIQDQMYTQAVVELRRQGAGRHPGGLPG